jgi:hypothetical protein
MDIKLNAYAIFVEDEYKTQVFIPYEKDEWSVKITAALKSDPKIPLDEDTDVPETYRYSVYIGDEYIDKLYQRIEPEFFYPINEALQNNPKIVWIETDYEVFPEMSWQYVNNVFVRNEQ